jgi:hypothetical protein
LRSVSYVGASLAQSAPGREGDAGTFFRAEFHTMERSLMGRNEWKCLNGFGRGGRKLKKM